jgi:hypothetical protein
MRLRHFRPTFGVALVCLGAALLFPQVSDFFASDACLDSGGSYDYRLHRCDWRVSHPYIPFFRDWSFWLGALVASAGLGLLGREFAAQEP